MAKLSEKYETMVVYSLKNGEEQIETLGAKFTALIREGATLVNVNEWGKRRLAYPINYENDGYYVLYAFDATPDFPKEFERVLNITEGVIRFLTVLRNDAPAKPEPDEKSAQVAKPEKAEEPEVEPENEPEVAESATEDEE